MSSWLVSCRRLDAVDPNAYDAFKASRNLGDVIERVLRNQQDASNGSGPRKSLKIEASLMTPVQPMLVRATWAFHHQVNGVVKFLWRCSLAVVIFTVVCEVF